jgi:hypothetical protein
MVTKSRSTETGDAVITLGETYPTSRTMMFATTVYAPQISHVFEALLIPTKADGYSWFYMYYWFSKKWPDDWKDTDVSSVNEPATPDNVDVQSASFEVDEDSIDSKKDMPPSCRRLENIKDTQGNPKIECDYTDPADPPGPLLSDDGCVLS